MTHPAPSHLNWLWYIVHWTNFCKIWKHINFHTRKLTPKCCLQSVSHFCLCLNVSINPTSPPLSIKAGQFNWIDHSSHGVHTQVSYYFWEVISHTTPEMGWGLLKLHSLIPHVGKFSALWKYLLDSLNHIHICQVSPQRWHLANIDVIFNR